MIMRTFLLLGAMAAAGLASAGPAAIKVGDSWTFEARDGYTYNKSLIAEYRVEVTGVSDSGIATRVTNLADGAVGKERFTRGWNPVSAEWATTQPHAFSMDRAEFPDRLLPGVRWQRETFSSQTYMKLPAAQPYEFSPAYPEFPERLEPGITWHGETVSRNTATGRQMKMEVSGRVVGTERVRVPAGEFDAIRIERETYLNDENSWHSNTRVVDTEWFAPLLGRSVKYETRSGYFEKNNRQPVEHRGEWTVYELASFKTK